MISNKRQKTVKGICLAFLMVWTLFPIYWMFTLSIRSQDDLNSGFSFYPRSFSLDNFIGLFTEKGFLDAILNSLFVTCTSLCVSLVFGVMCSYILSRARFKFGMKGPMLFWVLLIRILPPISLALPIYIMMTSLGIINTMTPIVLAHILINVPFIIWFLLSFFQSFPSAEERQKQEAAVFERMPKISILVPLWNTPESFLTEMIGSVQWQTYKNWELCLADGSDDAHAYVGEYCKRLAAEDSRIVYQKLAKNEGISGNTNECYKLASGEFIGLFDHDDILHPCALYEYVKAINEKDADFIYCDEATFKSPDINKMITMHFKPDYAIDNLRANNYICHFSVFSRELLDGTELFRTKFDGSQDHDMILRLTDNAKHIVHVPKLLYYWRSHAVFCHNYCVLQ